MGQRQPTANWIAQLLTALAAVLFFYNLALAGQSQEVRLFVVEKSKNPQNILVVYARVNAVCETQPIMDAGNQHLFDFYWLMDGTRFKPTHRLIKRAARKRFVPLNPSVQDTRFTVLLTDLTELNHDLPSNEIDIEMYRDPGGACRARAVLKLGPTHANRTMAIDTIYSEAKTFLGIPVGIHYIELRGKGLENNDPIFARFDSSRKGTNAEAFDEASDDQP